MPRSIQELTFRHKLVDACIRELQAMNDPRAPAAIEHYIQQQRKIDAELTEAEALERRRLGLPDPEPVVVHLKTAILFPKSERT